MSSQQNYLEFLNILFTLPALQSQESATRAWQEEYAPLSPQLASFLTSLLYFLSQEVSALSLGMLYPAQIPKQPQLGNVPHFSRCPCALGPAAMWICLSLLHSTAFGAGHGLPTLCS